MKFERPTGFVGSIPRNWIDSNLPRCPFCKLPSLWEYAEEFKPFIFLRLVHSFDEKSVIFSDVLIA